MIPDSWFHVIDLIYVWNSYCDPINISPKSNIFSCFVDVEVLYMKTILMCRRQLT